jgi:cytochrome c-type biogenesis protein
MIDLPSAAGSFLAGLLSFLSPCVLPLVPSYLAVLSGGGSSISPSAPDGGAGVSRLARAVWFCLGFSAVFVAAGLAFASAGLLLGPWANRLVKAAGVVVIVLGLNLSFDFLKFLKREVRFHPSGRARGAWGAFGFGAAFAAGWSPCVGPILASILALAGSGSPIRAAALLGLYSLGFALPFLAVGFAFDRVKPLIAAVKRHRRIVDAISSALLVGIGLAMLSGWLQSLTGWLAGLWVIG